MYLNTRQTKDYILGLVFDRLTLEVSSRLDRNRYFVRVFAFITCTTTDSICACTDSTGSVWTKQKSRADLNLKRKLLEYQPILERV